MYTHQGDMSIEVHLHDVLEVFIFMGLFASYWIYSGLFGIFSKLKIVKVRATVLMIIQLPGLQLDNLNSLVCFIY